MFASKDFDNENREAMFRKHISQSVNFILFEYRILIDLAFTSTCINVFIFIQSGLIYQNRSSIYQDGKKMNVTFIFVKPFGFFVKSHINLDWLFNAKAISVVKDLSYYLIHTFPKCICSKVTVKERLESELVYCSVSEQYVSH